MRGGWAIDFLLGKVTRPHDDIDLITWIQNREQLECALAEAGY
ncbi:nucleotidyltransferase domain-containing protein [Paenibacillus puldeungensis]|uniref:Nucleotidyltransferase domain-containing protein n=1 Tax=Paenibacillus puldeungensis TaxID=696536 RepID=A0ABW3RXB1_9BACL